MCSVCEEEYMYVLVLKWGCLGFEGSKTCMHLFPQNPPTYRTHTKTRHIPYKMYPSHRKSTYSL